MPIYEYKCPKCGVVEAIQKISADPLKKCPACKEQDVERLVSSTSFQLKGSGWYQTDYAGKSPAPASDSTASTKDNSSESSSKDSKDAAKSCGSGCKCC